MPDIVHWQEQLLTICRHSTGGTLQFKATNSLSAQICEQQCVPVNASVHLKALNVADLFYKKLASELLTHGRTNTNSLFLLSVVNCECDQIMLVLKIKKKLEKETKNDGLHVTVKVLQLVLINYWSLFMTIFFCSQADSLCSWRLWFWMSNGRLL